jgi:translation initiation factor 1A
LPPPRRHHAVCEAARWYWKMFLRHERGDEFCLGLSLCWSRREQASSLLELPVARANIVLKGRNMLLQSCIRGAQLGKKKVLSEGELNQLVLPAQTDVLGIAIKLLGYDRILVRCQDGHERLCRIRGKMKRRVWIREGDVVLVSPWEFQTDKRGDLTWRYTRAQAELLRKRGFLTI